MRNNKLVLSFRAGSVSGILTLMIVLIVTGCTGQRQPEKPKDLIPEDTYIDLLIEMQHLQSYRNANPDSVNVDSLKTLIFNEYGVKNEQFLATHSFYQHQPDRHLRQIDTVLSKLDKEELKIRAFIDSVRSAKQKTDTTDTMDTPLPRDL